MDYIELQDEARNKLSSYHSAYQVLRM